MRLNAPTLYWTDHSHEQGPEVPPRPTDQRFFDDLRPLRIRGRELGLEPELRAVLLVELLFAVGLVFFLVSAAVSNADLMAGRH